MERKEASVLKGGKARRRQSRKRKAGISKGIYKDKVNDNRIKLD